MKILLASLFILIGITASAQVKEVGIYLGPDKMGGTCAKTSKIISVHANDEVNHDPNYQILECTMFIGEKLYKTNKNSIMPSRGILLTSQMQNVLKYMSSGDVLSFNLTVSGVDGISRLIGGSFTIE